MSELSIQEKVKNLSGLEFSLAEIPMHVSNVDLADPDLILWYAQFAKREIWIDYEITSETSLFIVKWIDYLNKYSNDLETPITLHIFSPGGELRTMFTLYDAIKKSRIPIHTINEGDCHSAAFLVFLAGQKRTMRPYSLFIAHEGSGGAIGSYRETKAAAAQYDREIELMRKIIAFETSIGEDEINTKFEQSQDWYINYLDAIQYGIITQEVVIK